MLAGDGSMAIANLLPFAGMLHVCLSKQLGLIRFNGFIRVLIKASPGVNSQMYWLNNAGSRGMPVPPRPEWHFMIGENDLSWAILIPMSYAGGQVPFPAKGVLAWKEDFPTPAALHPDCVIPT